MLFVPRAGLDFNKLQSYGTTRPSNTTFGTTLTPVTTNAYSAYTQIGSDLTRDVFGLYINFNSGFTSATPRSIAVSIGVDYAGGTTYTEIFGGLLASEANNYGTGGGGLWYYFPIYIPAGAAVAMRSRSNLTTAFRANITFMQGAPDPSVVKKAGFVETLGLTLGTGTVVGTSVTPGTTAEGTWTLIGTTTRRCWWWQMALQQLGDTTMTANGYHLDIGVGDGTVGGTQTIITDSLRQVTATETYNSLPEIIGAEYIVPAGTNVYARIQNAGTNDGGTYEVVVYGCGG
jgi:hypothetical protein